MNYIWLSPNFINCSLSLHCIDCIPDCRPASNCRTDWDVCLSPPWCHAVKPCCKYYSIFAVHARTACSVFVHVSIFFYPVLIFCVSVSQDIFVSLSQVDGMYFVCNIDDFKFLADMIQHIPLNLRSRYVFCTAPINKKQPFVCTSFLKVIAV